MCFADGGLTASVPPTPASIPLPSLLPTSSLTTGFGEESSLAPGGAGDDEIAVTPVGPTPPNPLAPEAQVAGEVDTEMEGDTERERETETEEEKARRLLYCSLCKVAVNSPSQLEAHNSGKPPLHPLLSPLHSPDTA